MNDHVRICWCGLHRIPIGIDGINWYWSRHSEYECTVAPEGLEKCWCGLPKALHWNGHAARASRRERVITTVGDTQEDRFAEDREMVRG